MNRVLNIGNMTSKNSYNIYISLGKRSIKYIAKRTGKRTKEHNRNQEKR